MSPDAEGGLCLSGYDLAAACMPSSCKSGAQLQKHILHMFLDKLWRIKDETKIRTIVGKHLGLDLTKPEP